MPQEEVELLLSEQGGARERIACAQPKMCHKRQLGLTALQASIGVGDRTD